MEISAQRPLQLTQPSLNAISLAQTFAASPKSSVAGALNDVMSRKPTAAALNLRCRTLMPAIMTLLRILQSFWNLAGIRDIADRYSLQAMIIEQPRGKDRPNESSNCYDDYFQHGNGLYRLQVVQ